MSTDKRWYVIVKCANYSEAEEVKNIIQNEGIEATIKHNPWQSDKLEVR